MPTQTQPFTIKEELIRKVTTGQFLAEDIYLCTTTMNDVLHSQGFFQKIGEEYVRLNYQLMLPRFWELFSTLPIGHFEQRHFGEVAAPLQGLQPGVFDLDNFVRIEWSSHTVFRWGKEEPISPVYAFDYIGGVRREYYDTDAVFAHLREHPHVLKCQRVVIPSYNQQSDEDYDGLTLWVRLPQDVHDALYEQVAGQKFWAPALKKSLIPQSSDAIADPLKIKQFLIAA